MAWVGLLKALPGGPPTADSFVHLDPVEIFTDAQMSDPQMCDGHIVFVWQKLDEPLPGDVAKYTADGGTRRRDWTFDSALFTPLELEQSTKRDTWTIITTSRPAATALKAKA